MTERHTVRRNRNRGHYDLETARAVLDAGVVCHVGICDDGAPVVIPMLYARDGDHLLLHGAVASRLMRRLAEGLEVCVTVTHFDGLVLAASVFDHSANYRSVVVFGTATAITDPIAKTTALNRLVEGLIPGRGRDARGANPKEMNATTILRVPLEIFSVKIRTGGPGAPGPDDPQEIWTGVVPVHQITGEPEGEGGAELPDYLEDFRVAGTRGGE